MFIKLFLLTFTLSFTSVSFANEDELSPEIKDPAEYFSSGGAYSKDHKFSRNEVMSELYRFYGVIGKARSVDDVLPFLSEDEFKVEVEILNRNLESPLEYARGALNLRTRYPRIDRKIDEVDFEFVEVGKYRVEFRLTSKLYKPDENYFLTFRAKMIFEYKEDKKGNLVITYYYARPKISSIIGLTGAKRIKDFFMTLFGDNQD